MSASLIVKTMHNCINNRSFAKGFDSLSNLTGLHFTLYDNNQKLLLASARPDPLLSVIKAHSKAYDLYKSFIGRQLKLALVRKEPFSVQSITGQHHTFIPLHYEELTIILVAEAFYISVADFKRFYYSEQGRALGITERTEDEWLKDIRIFPLDKVASHLENMRSILQILVTSVNDNEKLNKYSQQAKTIISILSDINSEFSMKNIYQIVVDAVIFLFNIDTASIFLQTNGHFYPTVIEGRNRQIIQDLKISDNNRLLAKANATEMPVSIADSHELLHTGFPEEITSIHLFTFSSKISLFGLLVIINSSLDRVACDSISDLCKLTSYLCEVRQMKDEYENNYAGFNKIVTKTSSLYALYREPSRLYEGIVKEASELANAERCSLMISNDNEMLEIRAVKGVNRRFMENVKVRRGEGISGRVYESGSPILINGEAEIKEYGNSPRSQYKTLSSLSLPLKVNDEMIGVLNLSDKCSGAPFTPNDISMLNPFVLQASTLLKLGAYHETLEEVTKLSITDSLTGLFNRRYLDIRLEEEYLRAKRYHLILSLMILDIDNFKLFNDTEGHLAGDHILIEMSRVMSSAVRSHDILARFGGEEFAIIMPQTTKAEAFLVSERIRENIKRQIRPTWKRYQKKQITICSGIATYPECGAVKEDIIRYADRALYKAKNLGKDRTVSW